jgi:unsaturated rhamnogalacturonyl hydrolase
MSMRKADRDVIEKVKRAALSLQRFQWEQGTAAQAFLELGDEDTAILMAISAAYRNADDGRIGVMDLNRSVDDPAAVGEALLLAAERTGREDLKKATDKLYYYLKYRAPKTRDGILYHFNILNQVWVDAYYMAPPFLAAYGDFDEAMKQIRGFRKYLFHEECGLHSHAWDDDLQRYARPYHWGVGNGWAMAGVTRVLGLLPPGRDGDASYLKSFLKKMIDGCIVWQRPDGYFHDELDNKESFVDTNTGQMAAYAIYRGVESGYLDESYLVYADKAREAAYRKVDAYGFVQGVCGLPDFDRPYIAPEGQAFFLLMEATAMDLYEK